jgi:hypothetical protein
MMPALALGPLVALGMTGAAAAQSIGACDDFRSSAFALAEPWEESSRLFANGAVRLAVTDTIEPAAGAFHLVILSPPYDEVGGRSCRLVSGADGIGFAGLTLDGMSADYDPATGLRFRLKATRWLPETGDYAEAVLTVTLNQASGAVTARLD